MKFRFLHFVIALLLMAPVAAFSQEPLSLDSLQVALWPEYDRAAMLVIYRIKIPQDTQLPVALSFRIPAAAGHPNAVAVLTENGLVSTDYVISSQEDLSVVSFMSDTLAAQLEYYDPGLAIDGSQRSFAYTWPGDYALGDLQVEIQQPATASQLTTDPILSERTMGSDGLVYYSGSFDELAAGEQFTLTLDYSKPDDSLTISSSALPQEETAISPISNDFNWLWVIVTVALGLFGYGVYGLIRVKRADSNKRARSISNRYEKADVYCHQCGNKALAGDKFCRNCGTKLRR
jgi:hypothetical protein